VRPRSTWVLLVSAENGVDPQVVLDGDRQSWGILVRRGLRLLLWAPSAGAETAPRAGWVQAAIGAPRSGVGAKRRAWRRPSTAPDFPAEGARR
jgi:hypothetical protein